MVSAQRAIGAASRARFCSTPKIRAGGPGSSSDAEVHAASARPVTDVPGWYPNDPSPRGSRELRNAGGERRPSEGQCGVRCSRAARSSRLGAIWRPTAPCRFHATRDAREATRGCGREGQRGAWSLPHRAEMIARRNDLPDLPTEVFRRDDASTASNRSTHARQGRGRRPGRASDGAHPRGFVRRRACNSLSTRELARTARVHAATAGRWQPCGWNAAVRARCTAGSRGYREIRAADYARSIRQDVAVKSAHKGADPGRLRPQGCCNRRSLEGWQDDHRQLGRKVRRIRDCWEQVGPKTRGGRLHDPEETRSDDRGVRKRDSSRHEKDRP